MTVAPSGSGPFAAFGDVLERLVAAVSPSAIVAGRATVELDRAEVETAGTSVGGTLVGGTLAGGAPAAGAPSAGAGRRRPAIDAVDQILGARCRVLGRPDRPELVLLEPSTEGLLAAALARHGEGIVAAYLVAGADSIGRAREAGFTLSSEADGPLGRQRLVRPGPRWGPFLLLVAPAGPSGTDPR
jgi:hypothetical protein